MFQRAYLAAQILGIDKRTHDAMFEAIWKTGELAIVDPRTNRLKVPSPDIQDAAAWYAKTAGVKPEAFVSAANSFGVDSRIRQADQLVKDYRVESTPTMIVNGKYRLTPQSAGGPDQVIELVNWLWQRKAARLRNLHSARPRARRTETSGRCLARRRCGSAAIDAKVAVGDHAEDLNIIVAPTSAVLPV